MAISKGVRAAVGSASKHRRRDLPQIEESMNGWEGGEPSSVRGRPTDIVRPSIREGNQGTPHPPGAKRGPDHSPSPHPTYPFLLAEAGGSSPTS